MHNFDSSINNTLELVNDSDDRILDTDIRPSNYDSKTKQKKGSLMKDKNQY